jgi:hypothetical protein
MRSSASSRHVGQVVDVLSALRAEPDPLIAGHLVPVRLARGGNAQAVEYRRRCRSGARHEPLDFRQLLLQSGQALGGASQFGGRPPSLRDLDDQARATRDESGGGVSIAHELLDEPGVTKFSSFQPFRTTRASMFTYSKRRTGFRAPGDVSHPYLLVATCVNGRRCMGSVTRPADLPVHEAEILA